VTSNDAVGDILREWCERRDSGDALDREALLRAHPALAQELSRRLDALDALDRALAARGCPVGAPKAIGDFEIVRPIGRGGMGVVYEAEQVSMRRRVALKVLSPGFTSSAKAVRRFRREAQAAGRLQHTNIVPIYAMGQEGGYSYYAMELVSGPALSKVIVDLRSFEGSSETATPGSASPVSDTGDPRYFQRVAETFAGVADALQLAHEAGVVHRDIKPANLLLVSDGILKIVDFGLAQLDDGGASMTVTGDVLGTPVYMSPEQAAAKRRGVDHRTDIYSLGATLYEVLTLRQPFDGKDLATLCARIVGQDPIAPRRRNRRIPKDLETIVCKAMEKERDKRFRTAGDLARDLRRFADGAAVKARRIGPVGRVWRRVRRHKVRSSLAAAVCLLAAATGLFAWQAAREAERWRHAEYTRLLAEAGETISSTISPNLGTEFRRSLEQDATAKKLLSQAISLAPGRPEAYWLRALAPDRGIDERMADLDAARARGVAPRTCSLARAYLLGVSGRWREAETERARAGAPAHGSPMETYFEAELLYASGKRDEAIGFLTRVIDDSGRRDIAHTLALRARARLRIRGEDYRWALEDLYAIQALGDDGVAIQLRIASVWRRMGQDDVAARLFEKCLARARANNDAKTWHALTGACSGNRERGWRDRASRAAAEANPGSPGILWMRAFALNADGVLEESLALCNRILKLDSSYVEARLLRADVLVGLDRPGEALPEVERYLKERPDRGGGHYTHGLALASLKKYDAALEAYDRALKIQPAGDWIHFARGVVLAAMGRHEDALEAYAQAMRLNPANVAAHHNRTGVLLKTRRYEEALEASGRELELLPEYRSPGEKAEALHTRALILKALRRPKEALVALDRAIGFDAERGNIHGTRCSVLLDLGNPKEALAAGDRAVALDNGNFHSHYNRAIALTRLGMHQEAIESYGLAIALDPSFAWARVARAGLLAGVPGKLKGALADVRRAIEVEPEIAEAHYLEGVLRNRLRQPQRALAAFAQAITRRPRFAAAHREQGRLFLAQRRYGEALAAFGRAQEYSPRWADPHCDSGDVHFLGKDYDKALASFQAALALDPGNARASHGRALVFDKRKDWPAVVDACRKAIAGGRPPWQTHWLFGKALVQLHRHAEAVKAFDRAEAAHPNDFYTLWDRVLPLRELNRYDEALDSLDRALARQPRALPILHAERAFLLASLGRFAEVPAELGKAGRSGVPVARQRFRALCLMGRFDEALGDAKRLYRVRCPQPLVYCLRALGRTGEARERAMSAAAGEARSIDPIGFAYVRAAAGEREAALRLLDAYEFPWHPLDLYRRARVHAVLGDKQAALRWLRRAAKKGLRLPAGAAPDPEFVPFAKDAGFGALWSSVLK